MKKYFYFLSLFFLISCSPQDTKWKDTIKKNKISSYEQYLKDYPTGKYTQNAKDSIANLFCDSAKNLESIPILKEFVSKFPDNKRISEINEFIEVLDWKISKLSNSIDTIQTFINTYPNSKFIDKALFVLDSVKYAPSINTIEECMILATKTYFGNPNSKLRTIASIAKINNYDKKLGYMLVEGMCTSFVGNSEYYTIPKYYKLSTDGKGNWSAVYIAE